jgi:catechol 2,3-dioxygenase-like lactoylglutathione lyase family enzyme
VAIRSVEIGMVSGSDALVDFYVAALGVPRLEPMDFPFATLHRLRCDPVVLKVMVPKATPAAAVPTDQPWDVAGLRYLTLRIDALDPFVERWTAAGGTVRGEIVDLRPGVRLAVLVDPEGTVVEAIEERA